MSAIVKDAPGVEGAPDTEKLNKPAKLWFNWWRFDRLTIQMLTGQVLGVGRVREPEGFQTAEIAETRAQDWIRLHESINCECGFGAHCYLGPFEEGKVPPV